MEENHTGDSVALIQRPLGLATISQRVDDGYIEVTPACKAAGKQFSDYSRLESTISLLEIESRKTGISPNKLIISHRGRSGGTWVHPRIAISLGQWLSPEYASAIIDIVEEWNAGKAWISAVQLSAVPVGAYLRRTVENRKNVSLGYFSILEQVADLIAGPLESYGYVLPDGAWPDISVGITLAAHLRKSNIDTGDVIKYTHRCPNDQKVKARAYPDRMLPLVRKWIVEVWIPQYAPNYFEGKKEPRALELLNRMMIEQAGMKQLAA